MISNLKFCRMADRRRIRRKMEPVLRDYTARMAVLMALAIASALFVLIGVSNAETLYVNTKKDSLCARYAPDRHSEVMYLLERGEAVEVDAEEEREAVNGWIPVRYGGDPVWCWGDYLSHEPVIGDEFTMTVEDD